MARDALVAHAERNTPAVPSRAPLPRWGWLPHVAGLAFIGLFVLREPAGVLDAPYVALTLNLIFLATAGAVVAVLAARAHAATREPALALLFGGAAAWSLASIISFAAAVVPATGFDANLSITVHNMGVWLAAALHLGAVAVGLRGGVKWQSPVLPLAVVLLVTIGFLTAVVAMVNIGAMPRFIVPDEGGTFVRQFVLGATVVMLALCGVVLLAMRRASAFFSWYGLGLLLLAEGLLGVALLRQSGDALNWLGRLLQYAAGAYMLVAAWHARHAGAAALSLDEQRARPGVWIVFTVAVVTGASVLRLTLFAPMGERAPYLVFVAAILVAAMFGGWRAGALASVLSTALLAAFLEPVGVPWVADAGDAMQLVLFIGIGFALSYFAEAMKQAQVRMLADAAARKEAESRERQFRTLAESIPQLAWMASPDGRPIWCNRRWYEYTGMPMDETRPQWAAVHDPAVLPAVKARWRDCVARAEPFEMVFPLRARDGSYRQFLTRGVPVFGPDGRVVQWFGTNTDVTEARRVEDALREADRRKDEFLAMLAHELRNPMAPIRTATEILRLGGDDAGRRAYAVNVLQRQVTQLSRLMDDLLDLSRINTGKLQLRRAPVDLRAAVRAALEACQPALDARGHLLQLDLPAEPIIVEGDAARLSQVVANLVNNAVKFTEAGGHIRVSLQAAGGYALLQVADSGAGIPPDRLQDVFQMFTQLHSQLSQGEGGLGIGLHLVRRLVEMHGGRVTARSEGAGRGAQFEVRLPLSRLRVAELPPMDAPPAPARYRVLVVDDNRDAGETLGTMLQLQGHEVHVEHDGAAGLEAAARLRPDAVLLDIGMPVMDGLEVARRLRATAAGPSVALIAISGWGQDEDRRRTQEAGFDAHLTKPVDAEELARTLRTTTALRRAAAT